MVTLKITKRQSNNSVVALMLLTDLFLLSGLDPGQYPDYYFFFPKEV